MDNKNKK